MKLSTIVGMVLLAAIVPGAVFAHGEAGSRVNERIEYYEARLKKAPHLFPVMVQLAEAYLDKARETGEAQWVLKARETADRSLAIQPTFEGYRARMWIDNHAHRFAEALLFAEKAAAASIEGTRRPAGEVLGGLIEAELGLGRIQAARKRLESLDPIAADHFYTVSSWARVRAVEGAIDQAVEELRRAAALAMKEDAPPLAGWAEATAARILVKAGRIKEAKEALERAKKWSPRGVLVGSVTGMLMMAENRPVQALYHYEHLLRHGKSAETHHAAFVAAKAAGREDRARHHFREAERMLAAPIAAGEVYTLGALAQLYLDDGSNLDRALELAEKNIQVKKDAEAIATLDALRAKAQ